MGQPMLTPPDKSQPATNLSTERKKTPQAVQVKHRSIILLFSITVSLLITLEKTPAQDRPGPKRVEIGELTGPDIEYIGRLGEKLGTVVMVSATITRTTNAKIPETYMTVNAVNGKPIEKTNFLLRSRGETPAPADVSKNYRVCESAEIIGGHPALHHEYEEGSTKIKQRRVAGMRYFSIASTLILIPD